MRVLAVGASGQFAGLVIPELIKRGVEVRSLVHKHEDESAVCQMGVAEVVFGDLDDSKAISAALNGMDGVFYIAPAFLQNEAEVGKQFVVAASEAGVRRFVFSSVIHPVLSQLSNHAAKAPVEEALLNSKMEWVFLQPAMFFQNFAASWNKVKESGVYAEPWANETRFTRVDYRDVAEVVGMAMTEDDLLYGTFELCSAGMLNRYEVSDLMSKVNGRSVTATVAKLPLVGGPSAELRRMADWYDKHPLIGNALTLRAILRREPRSLQSYFEELNSKSSR